MFIDYIGLIIGFVFLIKGANLFVDGAKNTAYYLKIPKIIIGLTIVAFGTSAPELAVSIKSILIQQYDIVFGNVIGSNIMNILLILGLSSLIHPLLVKPSSLKKEYLITTFLTLLFAYLLNGGFFRINSINNFTRLDGLILLFLFFVFLYLLIFKLKKIELDSNNKVSISFAKSILYTIVGIIMIIVGSNIVVKNTSLIAETNGVSQKLISLTIIALGTSLPELVTSVVATIKKEYDIAIGNIIGSNMFNIGVVIGLPITIFGGDNHIHFDYIDLLVMVFSILLLYFFSLKNKKITKLNGFIMLLIFFLYYIFIFING